MWCGFFINPLFSNDCVKKELNAVHNEFKGNINNDHWRICRLLKLQGNEDHPFSKFGIGSLETLSEEPEKEGLDIREEVIKFHDKHYSANVMTLALVSNQELDVLEKWVKEFFEPVKNKMLKENSYPADVLNKEKIKNKILFAEPVQETRQLIMMFALPNCEKLYKYKPSAYWSHLIGHEGKGSLLSCLKDEGLANELCAGNFVSFCDVSFFEIDITLTNEGVKNYEKVIKTTFEFIELCKKEGIQQWIFEEERLVSNNKFRFRSKSAPLNEATHLSSQMQTYNPREAFTASSLMYEFDEKLLKEVIDMFNLENCIVLNMAPKALDNFAEEEKLHDPYFKTPYVVKNLSDDVITHVKGLKDCRTERMCLPEKNEFLASQFELYYSNEETKHELSCSQHESVLPEVIETMDKMGLSFKPDRDLYQPPSIVFSSKDGHALFKQDSTFKEPKLQLSLQFLQSEMQKDSMSRICTEVSIKLIEELINEFVYEAELAGLKLNISSVKNGPLIIMSGFNDRISILLDRVVGEMRSLKDLSANPNDFKKKFDSLFERVREKSIVDYQQCLRGRTVRQALNCSNHLNLYQTWPVESRIASLKELNMDNIIEFIHERFLTKSHVLLAVLGNSTKEFVQNMITSVINKLDFETMDIDEDMQDYNETMRPLTVSGKDDIIIQKSSGIPDDENNAIYVSYQLCDPSSSFPLHLRAFKVLIDQAQNELFFTELRTKQQLGYIVCSLSRNNLSAGEIGYVIQSSSHSNIEMHHRILTFVDYLYKHIQNMSEKDYLDLIVNAQLAAQLSRFSSMKEEFAAVLGIFQSMNCEFDLTYNLAKEVLAFKKDDILELMREYMLPNGAKRRAIAIHINGPNFKNCY
eukprot:TRINITY_DN1421_c0_g1_i1.p1 TRINITY_DN1421_c0_g1~~TRINITY_DN1421_c0_g1_i1.p1  ORF type:complete len:866 (-),score=234.30 TRINITY_DN1421_c0_g1_i1:516-3113(-)